MSRLEREALLEAIEAIDKAVAEINALACGSPLTSVLDMHVAVARFRGVLSARPYYAPNAEPLGTLNAISLSADGEETHTVSNPDPRS